MVKKLITFPPVALALEMAHTYIRVGVARSAAALSYFLILTLFPMLLCVNYFIGLFHLDLEQLLTALDQLLPAQALAIMEDYLAYAADIQSPALLAAGLFTILVSASAGIRTLFLTMDELYQVRQEQRTGPVSSQPGAVSALSADYLPVRGGNLHRGLVHLACFRPICPPEWWS